jgi:hypothetical protein
MAGLFGSSALFLGMASCSRKKDGVLVEVSEPLANAGVEVRDWRRNGPSSISIQLFSVTAIPGNSWTLTIYDKDDRMLGTSDRLTGPRMRERDTIWLRFDVPKVVGMERAERLVVGLELPAQEIRS